MLLDDERYEAVINYGKEAINKLNANELEEGFDLAEQGWKAFRNQEQSGTKGITMLRCFLDVRFKITI